MCINFCHSRTLVFSLKDGNSRLGATRYLYKFTILYAKSRGMIILFYKYTLKINEKSIKKHEKIKNIT